MIGYRNATFDDAEDIHKLCNYYATIGLMLPRSRNSIYENLRDHGAGAQIAREALAVNGSIALTPAWELAAQWMQKPHWWSPGHRRSDRDQPT